MTLRIRPFEAADEPAIVELWNHCQLTRPQNNPHKDIARKLALQPELFLVATIGTEIVGTAMAGYEGHRGWINYLAVAPNHRRRGIGRELMREAERLLSNAGCPKINLQIRATNREVIEFYQAIGFSIDDVVSMGKRLLND